MRKTPEVRADLMKHFHGLGYSLREIMHQQRLGYHPETLAKLARQYGFSFIDLDEVEAEGRELRNSRRRR